MAGTAHGQHIVVRRTAVSARNYLYAFVFVLVCAVGFFVVHRRVSKVIFQTADLPQNGQDSIFLGLPSAMLPRQNQSQANDQARTGAKAVNALTSSQERHLPRGQAKHKNRPLNILLLYADDWSFSTLGAQGNSFVDTSRLDRLAKEGILFSHNCVTTSICMVSRATLFTGQYASVHQTWGSLKNITMYKGDNWEHTLFPLLKASPSRYYTGLVGKWHHDYPPTAPQAFDVMQFYSGSHYIERDGVVQHVTQWNEDDAMQFLRNRPGSRPFALAVSFFATHAEDGSKEQYRPMNSSMWLYANSLVPYPKTYSPEHIDALPPFFKKWNNFGRGRARKRYFPKDRFQHMMKNTYRMATEVDAACGRIIDELEKQGVLGETLIIFTTDNGNFHGQHGLAEKWFAYEESIRVPLIIRDPRMPLKMRGTVNDEFTLNIDLAPTILSAAQVAVPQRMQGRDIAELYLDPARAEASWRKEFWYEWRGDRVALPSNNALVRKDSKYIYWPQYGYEQLFYLHEDRYEEYDVMHVDDKGVWQQVDREQLAVLEGHREKLEEMKTRMSELERRVLTGAKM